MTEHSDHRTPWILHFLLTHSLSFSCYFTRHGLTSGIDTHTHCFWFILVLPLFSVTVIMICSTAFFFFTFTHTQASRWHRNCEQRLSLGLVPLAMWSAVPMLWIHPTAEEEVNGWVAEWLAAYITTFCPGLKHLGVGISMDLMIQCNFISQCDYELRAAWWWAGSTAPWFHPESRHLTVHSP